MHSLPNRAGGAPSRPCRRCPRLLPGQRRSLPAAHRCGPAESLQNRVGPPHGWSAVGRGLKRRTSNRLVNIARRRQPNVPPPSPGAYPTPKPPHQPRPGTVPPGNGALAVWRLGATIRRFGSWHWLGLDHYSHRKAGALLQLPDLAYSLFSVGPDLAQRRASR